MVGLLAETVSGGVGPREGGVGREGMARVGSVWCWVCSGWVCKVLLGMYCMCVWYVVGRVVVCGACVCRAVWYVVALRMWRMANCLCNLGPCLQCMVCVLFWVMSGWWCMSLCGVLRHRVWCVA